MKRILLLTLVVSFMLGIAGVANAALMDVTSVTFNKFFKDQGFTRWSHVVTPDFTVPYDTVNWASLAISGFAKNASGTIIAIEDTVTLGPLSTGNGIFAFKIFDLTQYFQAGWGTSNGTFDVTFAFNQPGGNLYLKNATLAINYTNNDPPGPGATPTPEPGTLLLLGSGLVGLAAWGRKKTRK